MPIIVDSQAPLASLEAQGYECKVAHSSTSTMFSIGPVKIPVTSSSSGSTRYRFILPEPPRFLVSFAPERARHKLIKVFRKELQLNEPDFDSAVYIDTDDDDDVAKFLENGATRRLVHDIVAAGGQVAASEKKVNVVIADGEHSAHEEQLMAAMMLAAIMNYGR